MLFLRRAVSLGTPLCFSIRHAQTNSSARHFVKNAFANKAKRAREPVENAAASPARTRTDGILLPWKLLCCVLCMCVCVHGVIGTVRTAQR